MIHDKLPAEHWVSHSFTACCSCGWKQPGFASEKAAIEALERHQGSIPKDDEVSSVTFS